MDSFYLRNVALYEKLVKRYDLAAVAQPSNMDNRKHATGTTTCARIRPVSVEDTAAGFPCALVPDVTHADLVHVHDLYNHPKQGPLLKSFRFEMDRIYSPQATTSEIYNDLVTRLIASACKGGIGTLFAYGQTGSGKTFTISEIEELVIATLMTESLGVERQVTTAIIELAGSSGYDLLNARTPITLLEDDRGAIQWKGVTEHGVKASDEGVNLMKQAALLRKTSSTTKNDASSRSHAICRIRIQDSSTKSEGLLYIIDLAGSEAARDIISHDAVRTRETREINMSLSVLKDCLRGKAEADRRKAASGSNTQHKNAHIPFRRSALTKVLKHVFEPDEDKTSELVVIACLNPSLADVGSSKNTLRYAEMLCTAQPTAERMEANTMGGIRRVPNR